MHRTPLGSLLLAAAVLVPAQGVAQITSGVGSCICRYKTSLVDEGNWEDAPCAESVWVTTVSQEDGRCYEPGTVCTNPAKICDGTFIFGATSVANWQCLWKIQGVHLPSGTDVWFEGGSDPEVTKNVLGECGTWGKVEFYSGPIHLATFNLSCRPCSPPPE